MSATPRDAEEGGRLADNVLLFCRTLRKAGLPVGPGQVIDALQAVRVAGIERRDQLYWALRAVLVKAPDQFRLFDQAFYLYFRNPRLLERMMALLLPTIAAPPGEGQGEAAIRRLLESLAGTADQHHDDQQDVEIDQSASFSHRELLRQKDFEQMSLTEQNEAKRLLRERLEPMAAQLTRRYRSHPRGERFDMRRSMQLALRNNGQMVQLARKRRRRRPPTLVLLCDISGSMGAYSRLFLHFAHAMSSRQQTVHSFVFGTRLTNISHRLNDRDVDRAMAQVSGDVVDWDGGTRIADCLQRFNVDWGRRVLAQNAVVILLSDGLERDTEADLEFQMRRLQATCRQLVWLNPMLRYAQFEPKASGIRIMLPCVDRFLPAHNVNSLLTLARLLQHDAENYAAQLAAPDLAWRRAG